MNIKILQKSEIIKFDSPLAEPELNWSEPDYTIERKVTTNNEIVWYGINTNWIFENNKWFKLIGSDFVECEEPIYETLYKELN